MTLIEQIKQDQLNYRKTKQSEAATLLTTLIGESEMIGKNAGNRAPSDEEVQAVIKKFIKNNSETMQHAEEMMAKKLASEIYILSEYLPVQLDEAALKAAVAGYLLQEDASRNMGAIMAWLKAKYGGNYDGKTASAVVKAALA